MPSRFLALVCLVREDVFERQGLIEYNFHCFRESLQQVGYARGTMGNKFLAIGRCLIDFVHCAQQTNNNFMLGSVELVHPASC